MTLQEASEAGISRLRRPMWVNPSAYIKIDLLGNGMLGPWMRLYDRETQSAIGEPTPQVAPLFRDSVSDYQEYIGEFDALDVQPNVE